MDMDPKITVIGNVNGPPEGLITEERMGTGMTAQQGASQAVKYLHFKYETVLR